LEDGSEEAKRAFLRAFPDDPLSEQFAQEAMAFERKEFAKRVKAARDRIELDVG
jgi:hypothetical protein